MKDLIPHRLMMGHHRKQLNKERSMTKDNFHIGDIYRMSYGKRWQILGNMRQQSLAEHSYNVAVIAIYILTEWKKHDLIASDQTESPIAQMMIMNALLHDYEEIFTGDIPAGTKRHIMPKDPEDIHRKIGGIANLGSKPVADHVAFELLDGSKLPIGTVVKCADYIDAIAWLFMNGMGDNTAVRLEQGLNKRFNEYLTEHLSIEMGAVVAEICNEACHPSGKLIGDLFDGG